MTKLDSRLRKALIAARDLSGAADAPHGAGDSTRGRQLPQSTRVRALVAEQLVRMGFDATAIERELAAERAKSHRRLEELKAEAVAQSGVRADSLGRMVDAQRATFHGVIGIGPTTQYLALDSPVEIWATDGVNLESTTIEPYKSRAQIRLDASESHDWWHGAYLFTTNYDFLHFYFLWGTKRVVRRCGCQCISHPQRLLLRALARRLVFRRKGGANSRPTLDLLQTWTQPITSAPPQIGETWNVLDLVADSTGFDTDDKTNYDVVYRGTLVGYQQEIVPPGQNVIIDVALRLGSCVDNAEVSADFATGEFYVMSPLVSLTIVYPRLVVVESGDTPR